MMNNKKGATQMLILISAIAGLITILSATGVISIASITGSGSYIMEPVFYYDKCEAVSSYKYSAKYQLATSGSWLQKPSITNKYDVSIDVELTSYASLLTYSICNSRVESESNCRVYNKQVGRSGWGSDLVDYKIADIKPEESVWIWYGRKQFPYIGYKDHGEEVKYQLGFIPYGIRQYNVLGGSANQINPNSCTYPSTQRDTILFTDADKVNSQKPSNTVNQNTLQPEEVRWYVAGYLTSASPNFKLSYNGKDAWCRQTGSSGEIYQINEIKTSGGTYKIASVDWSDHLGNVGCCPTAVQGDEVCNSNFKWEKVQGSECGTFNSCGSPNWVPYSSGTLIKYSCIGGYCESETKNVECANDNDCSDSNEVCDLRTYTCEKANINLDGQVIETIPDNKMSCEEKGGVWITQTSEDKSFLNWIGIGEPDIITQEYCEMKKSFNWTLWIGIGIIVVLLFFFRGQLYAGIKLILGKVGIRI